ncbi:MAG: hypothetical protein DWQ36_02480 [Acidobacteria bacterium]|nr:MAG: hypothetical protein DWQ30_23870 [Acidobacteriota bacterium]REK11307.1 MAG: hypothetical protein DWQ36_02480 [Acidobacteriota bacterium]
MMSKSSQDRSLNGSRRAGWYAPREGRSGRPALAARLTTAALFVAALLFAGASSWADEVDSALVLPTSAGAGETLTLVLEGTWPSACPPVFRRDVVVDGFDIEVQVSASPQNPPPNACATVLTPYRATYEIPALDDPGFYDVEVLWIDTPFLPTMLAHVSFELGEESPVQVDVTANIGESNPGTAFAYGTWPTGCTPELVGVEEGPLGSKEVYLIAESVRSQCGGEDELFGLVADLPLLSSGIMYEIFFVVRELEGPADESGDDFVRASDWFDVAGAVTKPRLQGQRFEVELTYNTDILPQSARLAPGSTADTALFFFFDPDNIEAQVKVLDGCAINDRFWVFAAASTDLAYTLSVRDTQTGEMRTYRNTGGNAAVAVNDTDAFDTCP